MQYLTRSQVQFAFCLVALAACGGNGSPTDEPCDSSLQNCGGGGAGGDGGASGGFPIKGGAGGSGGSFGGAGGGVACSDSSQCGKSQFCDLNLNSCGLIAFLVAPAEDRADPPLGGSTGVAAPLPPGFCVSRPDACDLNFAPVCGCDGKTYGNDCERQRAGVSKASEGKCDAQVIVVGPGGTCGTFDGRNTLVCDKGLFCEAPANQCSAPGGRGTCQAAPQVCTAISAPVCGCDGKTYGNDCGRRAARQSLAHTGACSPTTARLGEACGPALGITCERSLVCDPQPNQCNNGKFVGTCTAQNLMCTKEFVPVCGCDGRTYGNECLRLSAGVTKNHDGECKTATRFVDSGIWGGPHIELAAKDPKSGGSLTFDCGRADIVSPLEVDGNGNFMWKARYILTGGPTQAAPPAPLARDAIITGAVGGKQMKLSIQIAGSMDQPSFALTFGANGSFNFCL